MVRLPTRLRRDHGIGLAVAGLMAAVAAGLSSMPRPAGTPLAALGDMHVGRATGDHPVTLPSHCRPVRDSRALTDPGGIYRLRRGAVVQATAPRLTLFVDSGAQARVEGDRVTVFAQAGALVTVIGARQQVYAEQGSSVVMFGGGRVTPTGRLLPTAADPRGGCA